MPGHETIGLPDGVASAVERLARRTAVVHVVFGDPYVTGSTPSANTVLLAWSGVPAAQRAAARALLGVAPVRGRLPIALPPRYARGHGLEREALAPALPSDAGRRAAEPTRRQ